MRKILLLLFLFVLPFTFAGCTAHVGDSCGDNRDCASGQFCDSSVPGGYCVIVECRTNSCPAEAWCATAQLGNDHSQTYCLEKCENNDNCRGGLACRFDLSTPGGVCYLPASDGGT